MQILVIEDEPRIRAFLARGLEAEGFRVDGAENGSDGLRHALDRVEELSVWRNLDTLRTVIDLDETIVRAVADGRIDEGTAGAWHARQVANDTHGAFLSLMPKVQIVAECFA